jgi:hypothetical protein
MARWGGFVFPIRSLSTAPPPNLFSDIVGVIGLSAGSVSEEQ